MPTKALSLSPPSCCNACPKIFDVYPHPSTIQVEISGNAATNPIRQLIGSSEKDEFNWDNFELSAVLDLTPGSGCANATGSAPTGCEPPYPTTGCCAYYSHSWYEYSVDHKKYFKNLAGDWVFNAPLSNRRTAPAHKILQCSVYRYEAANEWWAVVTGYIQAGPGLQWRGAAQIATSLLSAGTYDVALHLSCAPTIGDDLTGTTPPSGITWPDGVTSAGTATITVA